MFASAGPIIVEVFVFFMGGEHLLAHRKCQPVLQDSPPNPRPAWNASVRNVYRRGRLLYRPHAALNLNQKTPVAQDLKLLTNLVADMSVIGM